MFSQNRLYFVLRQRGCDDPVSHMADMVKMNRHLWCRATPEFLRPGTAQVLAKRGETQ